MTDGVYVKTDWAPPVNEKEILRYAGCSYADESVLKRLHECLRDCKDAFSYRVCYRIVDAEKIRSWGKTAEKRLENCEKAIVFAATVGLEIDRIVAKYSAVSPSKAVLAQAFGAERIESLCDAFCKEKQKEFFEKGLCLTPRFSPGYGDVSLERQKEIFLLLDGCKHIGISLTDNLLMSPTKSVTAIAGLRADMFCEESGCKNCGKSDCAYRKEL